MTKNELQQRIDALQIDFDAKMAALKSDLAKCDCAEGIEGEECWHAKDINGNLDSTIPRTLLDCKKSFKTGRAAYMPECRAVTAEDARQFMNSFYYSENDADRADRLHKLGFRIKVSP